MAAVSGEESSGDGSSSNLLQTFWGLSSLEEQERLQAARELLSNLRERQVPCVLPVSEPHPSQEEEGSGMFGYAPTFELSPGRNVDLTNQNC